MSSSSRPCFYLFVYGTLRSTFTNPYARLLARSADLLGQGRVRGRLYRLKRYIGIRLEVDAAGWIVGEIHRLHGLGILAALDRHEGPEYERILVSIVRPDGSRLPCLIYQVRWSRLQPATGTLGPVATEKEPP